MGHARTFSEIARHAIPTRSCALTHVTNTLSTHLRPDLRARRRLQDHRQAGRGRPRDGRQHPLPARQDRTLDRRRRYERRDV